MCKTIVLHTRSRWLRGPLRKTASGSFIRARNIAASVIPSSGRNVVTKTVDFRHKDQVPAGVSLKQDGTQTGKRTSEHRLRNGNERRSLLTACTFRALPFQTNAKTSLLFPPCRIRSNRDAAANEKNKKVMFKDQTELVFKWAECHPLTASDTPQT